MGRPPPPDGAQKVRFNPRLPSRLCSKSSRRDAILRLGIGWKERVRAEADRNFSRLAGGRDFAIGSASDARCVEAHLRAIRYVQSDQPEISGRLAERLRPRQARRRRHRHAASGREYRETGRLLPEEPHRSDDAGGRDNSGAAKTVGREQRARVSKKVVMAEQRENARDPVRRWTLIILGVIIAVFLYSIIADRMTPYTSQAIVQAYVVRVAPEVSGRVLEVGVTDNQKVKAGELLFRIDPEPYEIALAQATAKVDRG